MKGNYSAIAAKLKAIEGMSLSSKNYDELLAKTSVSDVCAYLASHAGYADVLKGLDKEEIHRTEAEKRLRYELLYEYSRVYSFMNTNQKKIFDFRFERREIEYIKRMLRRLYNHENTKSPHDEEEFEPFFKKHTKLDCEMLGIAVTLDEFITACRNTPYAAVLKRAENINADYFSLAMLLDRYYYESAWRAKNKYLSGKDRKLFEDLFGMEIDLNNILWIYRGKKYFNMSDDVLFPYLIPYRQKISEEMLKNLAAAQSDAEFAKAVGETPYGELFDKIEEGFFPEENKKRIYCRKAKSILQNEPESMAAVFAYFDLKETEIYNITILIESIRYNIDKQIIKRHIFEFGR